MILFRKRVLRVGIGSLLVWIMLICPALATQPQVPSKAIGYECSVSPTPELGKEFTVTFTLWLDEETYSTS